MIDLAPSMAAAVAAVGTQPGWLVEIGWSPPSRFSSVGDVSWGGFAWSGGRSVAVQGLTPEGGALQLGNTDDVMGALVLNLGIADVPVRVWAVDAGALDAGGPVLRFAGVGDSVEVGLDAVRIRLVGAGSESLYSPRRFCGPDAGINHQIAAGTVMTVGGQRVKLERR